jgi:Protein of unknown function (DUF3239)
MANMAHGFGEPCWGIQRLVLSELPAHAHEPGKRVPFVSIFQPGDQPGRWADFYPVPISSGTGDEEQLEACTAKLGNTEFDRVAECIGRGLVPDREDEISLVYENLQHLATYNSRKREGA